LIKAEVEVIKSLGVEIVTNCTIGKDVTFKQLRGKHDVVVIAIGCKKSRTLPIPGADAKGVLGGVDAQTGEVSAHWKFKPGFGTSITSHPNTGFVFEGFRVPHYTTAVRMAKELHGLLYGVHSIGWDVAISPEGPVFIEGNSQWSIEGFQAPHGGLKAKCRAAFSSKNSRQKEEKAVFMAKGDTIGR